MTIYIDEIFLENFILNSIILYSVYIISKEKMKFFRLVISSIIGSIYVIIYYIVRFPFLINLLSKLILSIAMIYIAFKPKGVKDMLKKIFLFFLVSFAFGGAALGAISIVNANKIHIKNGIIYGKYGINTILWGILIAFFVVIVSFKIVKTNISKKDMFYKIRIFINGKSCILKAMLDTGNLLKEPITNVPVVIVSKNALRNLLSEKILDNIEDVLGGDFKNIPEAVKNEYITKLKIIPFKSLGNKNGLLLGIKTDKIEVEENENIKEIDNVIVGVWKEEIDKKEEYKALIGIDLI